MLQKEDMLLRLSPLPKKIQIHGIREINLSDLVLSVHDDNPWTAKVAAELIEFFEARAGATLPISRDLENSGKFVIHLVSRKNKNLFQA